MIREVTPSGFWTPLIWLLSLAAALTIALILYLRAESRVKPEPEKTRPYTAATSIPRNLWHVKGTNLYWGFAEALKKYYDPLIASHTGRVTDYLGWLVLVIAIFLVILLGGG